jgi:hypothetical protein
LLPSYNKFLGKQIQLNDYRIFIYSGVLLLVFALISGIIPALYLSNFKPINTLKGILQEVKVVFGLEFYFEFTIDYFFVFHYLFFNYSYSGKIYDE